MGSELRYTIDTCSLTQMRRVYPVDIFPAVWERMSQWADDGVIGSIELVYDELAAQDDEVLDWAKCHKHIFTQLDEAVQEEGSRVLSTHSNLVDLKRRKSGADPFVIGHAIVHGTTIVTEEKLVGPGTKLVKIPNVCQAYSVYCIKLLDLLRAEGFSI